MKVIKMYRGACIAVTSTNLKMNNYNPRLVAVGGKRTTQSRGTVRSMWSYHVTRLWIWSHLQQHLSHNILHSEMNRILERDSKRRKKIRKKGRKNEKEKKERKKEEEREKDIRGLTILLAALKHW